MTCESRILKLFIALRRAQSFAAALLLFCIFIGALEGAVPAMQAQQAVVAAPAQSANVAPPPKAEIPSPTESATQILSQIANSGFPDSLHFSVSITTALLKFRSDDREFPKFTSERKL